MSSTEEEVPIEATSPLHTDSTYEAGPPPEEEWAQNPPSGPNTVQTRGVPSGEDEVAPAKRTSRSSAKDD